MKKLSDAARVPGAGKVDGKRHLNGTVPFSGKRLQRPRVTFPRLERDGVVAEFNPGWDQFGNCAGWSITILNPIAEALAAADCALSQVLHEPGTVHDPGTETLWDDLIPTHRRGRECVLQMCCPAEMIRKYISAAKRNGFKVVADEPAGVKGGAE